MPLFNFGGLADAIAGRKLKQIKYSDALAGQTDKTIGGLDAFRAGNASDLSGLSEATNHATAGIEGLIPGDLNAYSGLIRDARTDPFTTYTNVGNYQTGLLDRLAKNLSLQGSGQEKLNMARLGYGARGPSTYGTNTLLDRISRNLAPVYASTLSNIGRDATGLEAARAAGIGNAANLIGQRAGVYTRSLPLYSIPSDQRAQNLSEEIQALLGLGEATKGNTAGFQEQKSKWANALGAIDSSANSAADTLLSLYTGGLAGGSPGGGGGGFGGAGGGGFGGGGVLSSLMNGSSRQPNQGIDLNTLLRIPLAQRN